MRLALLLWTAIATAAPTFTPAAQRAEVFDYVEATLRTAASPNCFTDTTLTAELRRPDGSTVTVHGFCDAADGTAHRIRFLPLTAGEHRYTVRFTSPSDRGEFSGSFTAVSGKRKGLVKVDPQHPHHFVWSGTGERYFWNGLTTYALMGWQDEEYIKAIIDRAARYKVNHLRVTLVGPRVKDAGRWYEPLQPSDRFRFLFGPWIARDPGNVADPGWDVTRYDTAYWQKYERLVKHARERDVAVSVIFFLDGADAGADPFGKSGHGGPDERRYYRYASARLGAFSNVQWDISNEWHLFRSAWWVEQTGTYLRSVDPYHHLTSCHGRGEFPWVVSQWPDLAMYQLWDEHGGFDAMLQRVRAQDKTGRPMPQVNEEYGYEDHYPVKWGGNRRAPARAADNRRRLAWDITMAGAYQTTGERANTGAGESGQPTPGGWVNGGFDDSMTMLQGYRHLVDFFTGIEYWRLQPLPELASGGLRVLAEPGRQYVVYYPQGGTGTLEVEPGEYRARWFNPRTGESRAGDPLRAAAKGPRALPAAPDTQDWALLLTR